MMALTRGRAAGASLGTQRLPFKPQKQPSTLLRFGAVYYSPPALCGGGAAYYCPPAGREAL